MTHSEIHSLTASSHMHEHDLKALRLVKIHNTLERMHTRIKAHSAHAYKKGPQCMAYAWQERPTTHAHAYMEGPQQTCIH